MQSTFASTTLALSPSYGLYKWTNLLITPEKRTFLLTFHS